MEKQAFLGVDVSKGYSDFLLLSKDKSALEEGFQLQDNAAGRSQLGAVVKSWFEQGLEELYCGLESTGGYENHWYKSLQLMSKLYPMKVARLNAKGVKSVSDAALTRTVTDAVSAHNIAVYLMSFPEKIHYTDAARISQSKFIEGRQHKTYLRLLIKQRTQLNNQLEKLLYQYFDPVLSYCRYGIRSWVLRLLSKYPSPGLLVKACMSRLVLIRCVTEKKAAALIEKCKCSEPVSAQIAHVIAQSAKQLMYMDELIDTEKAYLDKLYGEDEQVKLLASIPGIGKDSAVALMLEIEDVEWFENAKKLSAYFGVNPMYRQSGDGTWACHMSKKGRGYIRGILYITALTGLQYNLPVKQIYTRKRACGMSHYAAMGVAMHKMMRLVYGVLKNKQPYNPEVDLLNQQQAEAKETEKKQQEKENKNIKAAKKHRFQTISYDAPVSRQFVQKRKKQESIQEHHLKT